MNRFAEEYASKKVTIQDVLHMIQSNDLIWTSYNGLEPQSFFRELHTIKDRVEHVTVRHAGLWKNYEFVSSPEMKGHFDVISSFYDEFARACHDYQISSYMPIHLHNGVARCLEDRHINMFVGMVCPMDEHGYVHFSLNAYNEMDTVFRSDVVVMLVNKNLPVVGGDNLVHISDIDYIVEVEDPLITIEGSQPGETEMKIGANVASLVEDGSTIQLGIGNIPNAVGTYLAEKNDLGVHTEMITSIIADLSESRVITGKKKTINRGKIVGSFALGNQRLYEYLDHNPEIALMSGSYVNDPRVICQNDRMVSINSCLQVDLTGQICSESMGHVQYSGTGGAADFAVGASHSKGGKSIVAVKSTAKKGTVSTIQPLLTPGAVVSISRNDIDYIITEYRIAKIKGKSIAERVENLIHIAHPKFRDELRQKAKDYKIW